MDEVLAAADYVLLHVPKCAAQRTIAPNQDANH
jgi:hypothetical protein